MRFPLDTTLLDRESPENNELQVSWNVTVSVTVRSTPQTWQQPGEQLVEDIRIDDVSSTFLTYGQQGQVYCLLERRSPFEIREYERTLAWLRSQLDERDYWRQWIESQARRLAVSLSESPQRLALPA